MNHTQPITPEEVLQLIYKYRLRWIVPAALVTLLAIGYAVLSPDTWQASQALTVRDEAIGVAERQRTGKFDQIEQMKAVQETIMELVRSRGVLHAALVDVGPARDTSQVDWPTAEDVEKLRKRVELASPNGAEFGHTEIFYLKVKDHERTRAVALASAICDQLIARFQGLRNDKAEGMVLELTNEASLAQTALDEATARLAKLESQVGSDLAELRILEKNPSGQGDLRQKVTLIETELRAAEEALRNQQELRRLLVQAEQDHDNLIATPNRLLDSQPALRRLKEGLIDAQLRTAGLLGSMSEIHPAVLAARESETEVESHLRDELSTAIRGVDVDLRLEQARVDALQHQLKDTDRRLAQIARQRADYGNLVEEIYQKTRVLNEAENRLAEVRSTHAAAYSTSLVSRIDLPDTGAKPIGPGKLVIVAAGLFGGLLVGAGVMFLTVPPAPRDANAPTSNIWSITNIAPRNIIVESLSLKKALAKVKHRGEMN